MQEIKIKNLICSILT